MESNPAGHAAALWVGLHLLLLLTLSALVVSQRRRRQVALGDGGVPELIQAIRAFGNASEYIPAGLVALLTLAVVGAPPIAVHLTGGVLFVGRLLHAVGLSRSGGASLGRVGGMVLTWLAWVFAGAMLLVYAIA